MKYSASLYCAILLSFVAASRLQAQMTYPPTLINELGGLSISATTTKCVILIHGWNPEGNANCYSGLEWFSLLNNVKARLNGSGWGVVAYDWHEDAATGSVWNLLVTDFFDLAVASTAAFNAQTHGFHLAIQLNQLSPNLREVHFIAHSAGSWAARQAAKQLLQLNPYVIVQITLLDPFVPNPSGTLYGGDYSDSAMNGMQFFTGSDRIQRLENYFANDSLLDGGNAYPWGSYTGPTYFTQETFTWRGGIDINQRVDWGAVVVNPPGFNSVTYFANYDWHAGPIQFYSDCVSANLFPGSIPSGLQEAGCPFDYQQIGWKRSLYAWESFLPQITAQPANQSAQTGGSATFNVTANQTTSYEWYKVGGSYVGSGSTLTLNSVSSSSAGDYVVRVSNSYGQLYSRKAALTVGPAPAPTISSVSPSTLTGLPLPQTQLIRILGSGFTSSSTLIFNGSIASDPARLNFINANELDYYIAVGPSAANWTVEVINGSQQSNLGTFTVTAPPPNTGSLTENLSPPGAVSAGAQWRVDGGTYHNGGDTVGGLSPGTHTVSFKSVSGYKTPADKSASITSGANTTDSGTYTVITPNNYTLTLSATHGYISASPSMSSYPADTQVRLTASSDDGYVFDHWSGDASGTDRTIYITMNGNKSVTANFVVDTSMGNVRVSIQPQPAIDEGAQWKMFPFTSWYNSGDQINGITPKRYYVSLKDLPGWVAPQNIPVDVVGGTTTQVTGTYQEIPGIVQVTIEPVAASAAGALWRLDGGAWQSSGATINGVPSGTHQIEFQSVTGWSTPASQQITVPRAGIILRTGQYAPPPGLTLITTISPKSGPIEGGTLLTIEGANFLASSTVFIGGRAASNITFLSTTRLAAVTPPSPVLGSAEIVVTTGTSSATNANAFAYGISRGSNMTLITSSGGMYQAVACNSQYLFIGQGTTFLVYDIANPANPIFVSSVTVPGLIQDIALSGNFAVVAANDAGVHIVDISNPAAPRLRGFYDTSGIAYGVKVLAGRAYVADESGGLLILDMTNPDAPTFLSSLDLGAFTFDVVLKNSAAGLYAILSARGKMFIVDVSNPQLPSKLSEVAVAGDNWSVALAGNLAFLGRLANGVDTVDISNLSNPVSRGRILTYDIYVTVAATGNTVVLAGQGQEAFQLVDVSGVNTTARGYLDFSVFSMATYGTYRMAIQNGVVWVAGGTAVFGVNISNLDVPQRILRKDDQGGRFEKVASFGANIAAATQGRVFAFNASGSELSLTAAVAGAGQSCGLFFYGDTLFDVDQSGNSLFERYQMQPNGNLTPLTSLTVPNVLPSDTYFNGSRLLSVGQTYPGDGHAVITEHDPSGANWILRQKHLSFVAAGGGVQIAGAQEFFFLAYFDSPSGKWNLASYNWSASTPTWQISGLEDIQALQLSHNNRFLHVGERRNYRIYDVADPSSPVSLSTNATTSGISDFLINGDEAYLAGFGQGVLVYDIADKSRPKLIRSYDTPGNAFSLAKIGDRLIVADYGAGIQVLGLPDIVAPQVFITAPVALPQFQTTNSSITLGGAAEDDSGQINRVVWSSDRGGGGIAQGTTDWLATNVVLQPGTNIITATAFDPSGNTGQDTLTVIYNSPKADQTILFPALADKVFGDAPITLAAAASSGLPVSFSVVSGPASLSNNVLSLLGVGAVTVQASQPGNDFFNPAPPTDVSFNVAKADQGIAFAALPDKSAGDPPFALNATASSGLPVSFDIISGPAVLDTNVVTLLGGGVVTVSAWQPGNSNYNAAVTVQRSFNVAKIPQTINFGPLSRQSVGDAPFPLSASASSGLLVSFAVLSGPAVLSGNIVTLTGAGTVLVRASQGGNGMYAAAANADQVLIVSPGNNIITDFQRLANGMVTFRFYADPGTNYVVQASTNLVNWLPLATNQVGGLGYLEFTDASSTNYARRFYRIAP